MNAICFYKFVIFNVSFVRLKKHSPPFDDLYIKLLSIVNRNNPLPIAL